MNRLLCFTVHHCIIPKSPCLAVVHYLVMNIFGTCRSRQLALMLFSWNHWWFWYLTPQGSGVHSSSVLHGMVFKKETEGDVTSVKDAKIAVYSCPFDGMITETKVCRFQNLEGKNLGFLFSNIEVEFALNPVNMAFTRLNVQWKNDICGLFIAIF